jgi:hypothetical protein
MALEFGKLSMHSRRERLRTRRAQLAQLTLASALPVCDLAEREVEEALAAVIAAYAEAHPRYGEALRGIISNGKAVLS